MKKLFSSSSLYAISVVSYAYLRLFVFLQAILIPACALSSPAFLMMYSAYKLSIIYYLHCAWRPQSSGKVERTNQFLKSVIRKTTQETSLGWKETLPIALLHACIAPKEQVGLSPYEMLYGRPFVCVNDLFLDPEVQTLQSYIMAFGQFQQDIRLWGVNQDPKDSKE